MATRVGETEGRGRLGSETGVWGKGEKNDRSLSNQRWTCEGDKKTLKYGKVDSCSESNQERMGSTGLSEKATWRWTLHRPCCHRTWATVHWTLGACLPGGLCWCWTNTAQMSDVPQNCLLLRGFPSLGDHTSLTPPGVANLLVCVWGRGVSLKALRILEASIALRYAQAEAVFLLSRPSKYCCKDAALCSLQELQGSCYRQ